MGIEGIKTTETTALSVRKTEEPREPEYANKVSFQSKPDEFVKTYEVEATNGKKWGVGIASFFLTGLGQMINGQWGKGIGMLLGGIGLGAAGGAMYGSGLIKGKTGLVVAGIASLLGAVGIGITSIVDAVKNAKSEIRIVDEEGLKDSRK